MKRRVTVAPTGTRFRLRQLFAALCGACALTAASGSPRAQSTVQPRHFAPNHNFDAAGAFVPANTGFDLADVNSPWQSRRLPKGVKGLVWVGQCNGVDARFLATVRPYIGNANVFGFYLMDDPDPRMRLSRCDPDRLKAEVDWIHANVPGTLTFIALMNLSSAYTPSFHDTYNPANSHVDLYGIDPYPCRTEANGCDGTMIEKYVLAAEAWGIPRSRMVPVYQTFGGGDWSDGNGGKYVLPTADQLHEMLARWRTLIPAPVFDYAYSWGPQRGDTALEDSPALREVVAAHNRE